MSSERPSASSPEEAKPAKDALLGRVLDGKIRLDRLLGKGGSGRVYAGTQTSLGRSVAVKIMRPDLEGDSEQRFEERFFREASLAGQLQHPNIVTVHDFGRAADGTCYIVMELLGGSDLKAELRRGPVEPERALLIFEQIVRGLRHAHRAGMIHRDMKPGNIRLIPGEDGRDFVKIMDFGLVKGEDEASEITQAGTFLGTPHYAAPEQVRGHTADGRSDLYAVGVMLYRAFCGQLPFWSANPMAIAMSHVQDAVPPMSERAPDVVVDPAHEAIVRRCMHKNAAERYPDAGALLADLVAARRALVPDHETMEGEATDDVTLPPAEARGRRPALAGVALLGLCAIGGGVWFVTQDPAPPPVEAPEPAAVILAEPEPEPAPPVAPALHEVMVFISSAPSAAEVVMDGAVLGVTPYADVHTFDIVTLGASRTVDLRLDGYVTQSLVLDVSEDRVTQHADLKRIRRAPASTTPASAAAPVAATTASAQAVVADGVYLSGAEAARALAWVNAADEAALRAAGVAGRQVNIILAQRPFADFGAVAATPFIGKKTVEAIVAAAR
jgi:eukaryotic-like serine/threonine-protein kinase